MKILQNILATIGAFSLFIAASIWAGYESEMQAPQKCVVPKCKLPCSKPAERTFIVEDCK